MLKEKPIKQRTKQQGKPNLAKISMLHTHVVDERLLGRVRDGSLQTMELDISSTEDGKYYIGHNRKHYNDRDLVFPLTNVSIEEAMLVIKKYGVFTKLDCKDKGAIPKIAELAQELGSSRCMLHAHIREFKMEPYWKDEDITLEEIIELRDNAGCPVLQVSCRGFTADGIATLESSQATNLYGVCAKAKENGIDVVNLHLPDNQAPPDWALEYFYGNGVLLEVYKANIGERQFPCDVFTTIEVE